MREEEMKKLIALVSTMAMAVSLAGCSSSGKEQSAASGVSGTFEGTAQGKGGDVKERSKELHREKAEMSRSR